MARLTIKSTDEVEHHLRQMQATLRPYIGTLQVIRFDHAKETRSDAMQHFLTTEGTTVEFSSPYVHEELGLVERSWQSIENESPSQLCATRPTIAAFHCGSMGCATVQCRTSRLQGAPTL